MKRLDYALYSFAPGEAEMIPASFDDSHFFFYGGTGAAERLVFK